MTEIDEKVSARVMEVLQRAPDGGLTPDEIAFRLNLPVLTVRPRVTELKNRRVVQTTGRRRRNTSGRTAATVRLHPTFRAVR